MRKGLYFLSAVIILGLLSAAYYVTGVRAEKEFNNFLKTANTLPNLKISAENYQRGWLKSTVHLHIILNRPPQTYTQDGTPQTLPAQNVSFSFDMDVYHGPVIFADGRVTFGLGLAQATVPLPDQILSQFNELFSSSSIKPTFNISLLLRYAGMLKINLNIPSFVLMSKDNQAQIDWKGLSGQWNASRKLAHIKGNVAFLGLTFKAGTSSGSIGPVELKYNVENSENGLVAGDASIGLQSFQFGASGLSAIGVEGFQAVSDSDIKTKDNVPLINSSLKADVRKVTYQGFDYGPGVLDVNVSNLDAEALDQIQQKLQAASNENLTDSQQQIFLLTLLPEVSRLLQRGVEIHVKQFQLSIPQGLILATAKVKLPLQQNANQNPLQLIQQINAYVTAEVPAFWLSDRLKNFLQFKIEQRQLMEQQRVEKDASGDNILPMKLLSSQEINALAKQQAVEQLQILVQNGVLLQKDNVYRIKVAFRAGTFYINGKPFNNKQIEGVNNDSAN
jgi:uncharacterized protein YdgA (DUF945 family)